ncbi:hypothetical protein [Phaffia rhodozyma]|uniref:Uncharacterized protein n=1 Tax=Phaffia rhodozyma TaxID=264483 RepID=A0A0F7SFP7_PHARH|nr:hypothetical protein [Phaffia rhodozyma]
MTHTPLGPSDYAMHDIPTQSSSIESSPLTTHASPLQIPTPASSTSSPPPVRFPSSFADFKLPPVRLSGIHSSTVKPNLSTWPTVSAHHGSPSFPSSSSSSSTGPSTVAMNESLEGYPLFHPKKHTRKSSTLSLNNHAHDDHLRIINRLPQNRPTPRFPSSAGSSLLTSSPGEGSPIINQPGVFSFGPTPSASSFGTLQPSVRSYPLPFQSIGSSTSAASHPGSSRVGGPDGEGSDRTDSPSIWAQAQDSSRPLSAESTAMLSPSSTKGRLRSNSPPGIPVLNPNGAEEGKTEASIRAVTRRGSLYPKHIAHTLTAKLLSTESNPSTSEIRSEAQIQRLLTSHSSSPTPFRSRSSLSGGPSSIGGGGHRVGPGNRFRPFFAGGRNRFPEDEGDLFDRDPLSEEDTSEDDDLCMEDEISTTDSPVDPASLFGGSSSFGQTSQSPALPHQTFTSDNRPSGQHQQLGLAKLSVTPMMINPSGRSPSKTNTHVIGDGEGDTGMMVVGSSPVMGSPRRRSGSCSGSGSIGGGSMSSSIPGSGFGVRPVTPGSAGMGWRESGGKKRKVAIDERFDPYASSLAFKRRAVSPSTTLLPPPTSSSYTNTPSFLQQSPVPSLSAFHPNPQSQSQSQSQTQPIPISLTYYTASSRHGSPLPMHSQILSSSAGGGTARSLGGSAPGYAGPGLGTSLLAREREGRRSSVSGFGTWEDDEAGLSGMKLG